MREARIKNKIHGWAIRLDLSSPGWADDICPPNLDLSSNNLCVVGQSLGNFIDSPKARRFRRTWIPLWRFRIGVLTPRPFFYLSKKRRKIAQEVWSQEIRARKNNPYDERARFLKRRIWITPVHTHAREEAKV